MRAFEILNEMVVRHQEPDGHHVVAHRDSIWVLSDRDTDESVLDDIQARTGMEGNGYYDFVQLERPDVVLGTIHGDMFYREGSDTLQAHPASSILLKKIVKHFKLDGVTFHEMGIEDSEETEVYRYAMEGKIPEIMFHGTNSAHLRALRSAGIAPNENENWAGVGKFYDRVFLTSSLNYAMFHANRGAGLNGSVPLVIATRLPDRNLIDLDFDVAGTFYGKGHDRTRKSGYDRAMNSSKAYGHDWNSTKKIIQHSPKTDFGRESGVISYKGRIPVSFFTYFVVPGSPEHENQLTVGDSHRVEVSDIVRAVEIVQEHGYYDPYLLDYEDEDDEDNWNNDEDEDDER